MKTVKRVAAYRYFLYFFRQITGAERVLSQCVVTIKKSRPRPNFPNRIITSLYDTFVTDVLEFVTSTPIITRQ